VLGFQHAGTRIQDRIGAVLDAEVQAGRIAQDGDVLKPAP
jgi:hypothetical protein